MNEPHTIRLLTWVVWGCVFLVVSINIISIAYAIHATHERRDADVSSCERGNRVREALNSVSLHNPSWGLGTFVIEDCAHLP